ncbi:MAG: YceI family protein [Asticcacaulis sp.]
MTPTTYNRYSRYLHWLMAGLILFMVFLGWRIGDHDSLRFDRVQLHKSVGISILLLTFLRIGLRLAYKAPPEPPMPKWQAVSAKVLHFSFYLVMLGMPLSGWMMVSTSAREIPFFGLFPWPHFPFVPVAQGHSALHELFENIHGLIAKLLIYGMIPLHVVAALKHQFVDKDTVMEHMVPGLTPKPVLNYRWLLPIGVVVIATGLAFGILRGVPESRPSKPAPAAVTEAPVTEAPVLAPVEAPAVEPVTSLSASESTGASASEASPVPTWVVDKSASKIGFATTFSGEAVKGSFGSYTAAIRFDPDQLAKSNIKVTIDLASVNSGNSDYDSSLKGGDFFNVSATPKAIFEATRFSKTDATHFVAKGKLTLHGQTKPLDLPFSLVIKNDIASVSGGVDLDRTAYGVGSGEWASTSQIPAKVHVDISLKAKASK